MDAKEFIEQIRMSRAPILDTFGMAPIQTLNGSSFGNFVSRTVATTNPGTTSVDLESIRQTAELLGYAYPTPKEPEPMMDSDQGSW